MLKYVYGCVSPLCINSTGLELGYFWFGQEAFFCTQNLATMGLGKFWFVERTRFAASMSFLSTVASNLEPVILDDAIYIIYMVFWDPQDWSWPSKITIFTRLDRSRPGLCYLLYIVMWIIYFFPIPRSRIHTEGQVQLCDQTYLTDNRLIFYYAFWKLQSDLFAAWQSRYINFLAQKFHIFYKVVIMTEGSLPCSIPYRTQFMRDS